SVSMNSSRPRRWRSTTKASESVSAMVRPEARARPAALAKARRASAGAEREASRKTVARPPARAGPQAAGGGRGGGAREGRDRGGEVDQRAAGGRPATELHGVVVDADGAGVVDEDFAELVGRHLPDVGGAAAQAGDTGHGVAGRSAGGLDPRGHARVQ